MSVSRDTAININDESAVRSVRISDLVNKEWKIWNGIDLRMYVANGVFIGR